jgi:phosphoglycerate dehydrogenase-like enzyme
LYNGRLASFSGWPFAAAGNPEGRNEFISVASNDVFRVGITPDFGGQAFETLGRAVSQILDPLPGIEHEIIRDTGGTAAPDVIDQYDAVIVFGYYFPKESFRGLKRLACLARWGVGYDRIDADACTEADVLLALTPNSVRRPVAEGIFAFIFALAKNLQALDARTRSGRWREDFECRSICVQGRTLGSVGVGSIGGEMFRMARALGFGRLLGYDPYIDPKRAADLGVELVDLDTVMRESDFVAVNTFLSAETRGLVGAHQLGLMKPTAYIINTARGPIIDEKALVETLRARRIAGAGIDVFEQEPPPKNHPLFALDNVIVAPHAVAWTEESMRDNSLDACRNVRAVYEGKAPEALANPKAADRPGVQAKLARRRKV